MVRLLHVVSLQKKAWRLVKAAGTKEQQPVSLPLLQATATQPETLWLMFFQRESQTSDFKVLWEMHDFPLTFPCMQLL